MTISPKPLMSYLLPKSRKHQDLIMLGGRLMPDGDNLYREVDMEWRDVLGNQGRNTAYGQILNPLLCY